MKIQLRYLFLLASIVAFTGSCMEELPTQLEYEGYEYAELDEDAGNWNEEQQDPSRSWRDNAGYVPVA